jgi:hypothetical protein
MALPMKQLWPPILAYHSHINETVRRVNIEASSSTAEQLDQSVKEEYPRLVRLATRRRLTIGAWRLARCDPGVEFVAARKRYSFLRFPYVCPEPVLAK